MSSVPDLRRFRLLAVTARIIAEFHSIALRSMTLIACPSCDAIYRYLPTSAHSRALCVRCGSQIHHAQHQSLDRWLALALAALIAFAIANVYPIVEIRLGSERTDATLLGALYATWNEGMPALALLVGLCAFAMPLLKLLLEIYVLRFAAVGRRPPASTTVLPILSAVQPWSMIEVFVIGVLVAIVKLGADATVIIGPGLGGLAALSLLMAALSGFDPAMVWARLDRLRA
ncbi:MAG: paraquat-inducible protein A [Panacagrimonas sp.]